MMALTQAEYLLMLAEDARSKGDDIADEIKRQRELERQQGAAHYKDLERLDELLDRAKEIVTAQKARFVQYVEQRQIQRHPQNPPMPRAVAAAQKAAAE